jgi:hypothetical protein
VKLAEPRVYVTCLEVVPQGHKCWEIQESADDLPVLQYVQSILGLAGFQIIMRTNVQHNRRIEKLQHSTKFPLITMYTLLADQGLTNLHKKRHQYEDEGQVQPIMSYKMVEQSSNGSIF